MLDDLIEIIIEFVLEFFAEGLCNKKMPLALRVIFGVLVGVGVLALGCILIGMGMLDNKMWMTVLGAVIVLVELGILLGVLRERRKEKDILY